MITISESLLIALVQTFQQSEEVKEVAYGTAGLYRNSRSSSEYLGFTDLTKLVLHEEHFPQNNRLKGLPLQSSPAPGRCDHGSDSYAPPWNHVVKHLCGFFKPVMWPVCITLGFAPSLMYNCGANPFSPHVISLPFTHLSRLVAGGNVTQNH